MIKARFCSPGKCTIRFHITRDSTGQISIETCSGGEGGVYDNVITRTYTKPRAVAERHVGVGAQIVHVFLRETVRFERFWIGVVFRIVVQCVNRDNDFGADPQPDFRSGYRIRLGHDPVQYH